MFQDNLISLRKLHGFSQDELAEKIGVTRQTLSKYETGDKGQIVIPANARKIFDIQPGDNLLILGDEEQGIAILKEKNFLEHLRLMERMRHMESDE